jgi:hypothetical protein
MSHQTTHLASAEVGHDHLSVDLIEPDSMPPMVRITWPEQPSIVTPKAFGETAAALVKMFSAAHIELARIRVWKKL